MKKRLLKDTWFQMFAAVGGVACVVSVLGTVSTRHSAPPAAPAAAAPAAAAKASVSAPGAGEIITPPAPASTDLAAYGGRSPGALIMAPTADPPAPAPAPAADPPPKFTLTGAGVGNAQGIPGAPAGGFGAFGGILNNLMGVPPAAQQAPIAAQVALPAFARVTPARPGIFTVGPAGAKGADTSSLRDAVFSAADGDLILLQPGTYEGPVEVSGLSLRIRGTGTSAGDVVVTWTGRGATVSVHEGRLDLEKVRIVRGAFFDTTVPGGAVYADASIVNIRKAELSSDDSLAPALIVEQGKKPTRVAAEDVRLSGGTANALARGPVKLKLTRVTFDAPVRALAVWLDAAVELADCRFPDVSKAVIYAYEGAHVAVTGRQIPRLVSARGAEATAFEDAFATRRIVNQRAGFARDIFRRGRRAGTLP